MTDARSYQAAIVGGGIVGLATACALVGRGLRSLVVLEAEDRLGAHQTGHNSGVIHSGLYYRPGSLKAWNCVRGREAMYRFCDAHGIRYERCGKVVVATTSAELPVLDELERRGGANGLAGLVRLRPEEIRQYEPHVAGLAALFVPETGIVHYPHVVEALARDLRAAGGEIRTRARVLGVRADGDRHVVETSAGVLRARHLVNCAGLQSDRVARLCGVDPGVRIIPFRGEYHELVPERRHLVRNLVYPVPDPRFPFLGVHFTRMIQGGIEVGPNAVLALKREGYTKWSFSAGDTLQMSLYRGFWRMAARYGTMGVGEIFRSFSRRALVRALQRLVPELTVADLRPSGAGVRAQAVDREGKLVDDFRIVEAERMIHVLNAPSPAATAALSIGETIAEMAVGRFGLG